MQPKVPPYDAEAEQAVIASVILDNELFPTLQQALSPHGGESFYLHENKEIYDAMLELYNGNTPLDAVTIGTLLKQRNALEKAGGVKRLSELCEVAVVPSNIERYARRVSELFTARSVIAACQNGLGEIYGDPEKTLSVVRKAIDDIVSAGMTSERTVVEKAKEGLTDLYDDIVNNRKPVGLVKTGIAEIDKVTGGMIPGLVYVMAARPSMGKSTTALNIAINAASSGIGPVLVETLEDPILVVKQRALARLSDIDSERILHRNIQAEDHSKLVDGMNKLHELNLWFSEAAGSSSSDISARATAMKARNGLSLLVVDHLAEINDGIADPTANTTAAMAGIRNLAIRLNIPVLLLHQLNRSVEGRQDKRPMLSDLRQSGAVEQMARNVWFLYRPGYYEGANERPDAELIIAKANHGRTGVVDLWMNLSKMYVTGWDHTIHGTPTATINTTKQSGDHGGEKWGGY